MELTEWGPRNHVGAESSPSLEAWTPASSGRHSLSLKPSPPVAWLLQAQALEPKPASAVGCSFPKEQSWENSENRSVSAGSSLLASCVFSLPAPGDSG